MPKGEIEKLCEIALSQSTADKTKRLFKANCKSLQWPYHPLMIINGALTNAEGKIDQNEIIEKLKLLQVGKCLTNTRYV